MTHHREGLAAPGNLFITPIGVTCKDRFGGLVLGEPGSGRGTDRGPGRGRICLLGFVPGSTLKLAVSAPDGTTITDSPTTDGDGIVDWRLTRLPKDPLGTYAVHAQQSKLAADTNIEVVPPDAPRSMLVPQQPQAGRIVVIWVGGLTPGDAIPAYLYRLDPQSKWQFTARLGSVRLDDGGFGRDRDVVALR